MSTLPMENDNLDIDMDAEVEIHSAVLLDELSSLLGKTVPSAISLNVELPGAKGCAHAQVDEDCITFGGEVETELIGQTDDLVNSDEEIDNSDEEIDNSDEEVDNDELIEELAQVVEETQIAGLAELESLIDSSTVQASVFVGIRNLGSLSVHADRESIKGLLAGAGLFQGRVKGR